MTSVSMKTPTPLDTSLSDARGTVSLTKVRAELQGNREHNKIKKAAHDFESILMGQWLEQAEKSFATVPGDDPNKNDQDPGQDQMRSIAFTALANGLSAAGGIGIAAMIEKRLTAVEARQAENDGSTPGASK